VQNVLRSGDMLAVRRLDRQGRPLKHLIELTGELVPSRSQAHDLTDTKLPRSDNRPINSRMVFVHTDYGFHYLGACYGCVRVKIDHHATLEDDTLAEEPKPSS
jgi:hypothetical protein